MVIDSKWIGRQLSRIKAGQLYIMIMLTAINALSLISLSFQIKAGWAMLFLPVLIIATLLLGYMLDHAGIFSEDSNKSIEMTYRILTIGERRNFDFLKTLAKAIAPDKADIIEREYDAYQERWK